MTTHYKNRFLLYIAIVILFLWSCTGVELCYEDNHPHSAKFSLNFVWGEFEEQKPDSMYVFLSRLINTRHYVNSLSTSQSDETKADGKSRIVEVEGGEYTIITCTKDTALFDITNKDVFETDFSVQANELTFAIKDTVHADIKGFDTRSWSDNNPGYKKLKTTGPIFCGIERKLFSSNMSYELSLNPQPITQHIKFQFSIEVDPKITITNIVGEISGVARNVKLTSGILDKSSTGRTYFLANKIDKNENVITYEGEVDVLGLFPNTSSAAVYGPGILELRIFVQKDEKPKTIISHVNLINTITNANLTVLTEDAKHETCNPKLKNVILKIGSVLTISEDATGGEKPGSEIPDGVDHWTTDKENGNIDMET